MRILRFDISTRVLHWSHAVFFIWLLITGIGIFLTPKSLLADPLLKMVHLYASIPFILLPTIIHIFGSASCRMDVRELMSWTDDDLKWFIEFLKKNKAYVTGKFNGGQKANFLATLFLIIGLTLSGFVVWMKSMFSVDFVELNFVIHDSFAVISILLLFGHIIFTAYYPESLRGVIYGEVNADWAEKHYPGWIDHNSRK
ncbi:MAG: cytochrome b/b6 domain-containing protein [Candidatus Methanoperedens sp.]|nr:cytochrome b/b6 domain-containing protein [Candidatus Methanoperedens sp.]